MQKRKHRKDLSEAGTHADMAGLVDRGRDGQMRAAHHAYHALFCPAYVSRVGPFSEDLSGPAAEVPAQRRAAIQRYRRQ